MSFASRYAGAALADRVSTLNARIETLEAQLATEQARNAALLNHAVGVRGLARLAHDAHDACADVLSHDDITRLVRHDHSDGWIATGLRRAIEERDAHWFEDAGRADARVHALRTGQYVDPRDDMPTLAECDRDEADMGGEL